MQWRGIEPFYVRKLTHYVYLPSVIWDGRKDLKNTTSMKRKWRAITIFWWKVMENWTRAERKRRQWRLKSKLWENPHYAIMVTILLLWPSNMLGQSLSSNVIMIFLHTTHFKNRRFIHNIFYYKIVLFPLSIIILRFIWQFLQIYLSLWTSESIMLSSSQKIILRVFKEID